MIPFVWNTNWCHLPPPFGKKHKSKYKEKMNGSDSTTTLELPIHSSEKRVVAYGCLFYCKTDRNLISDQSSVDTAVGAFRLHPCI